VKVAHDGRKWTRAVAAYTGAGAVASGTVGALLGFSGALLGLAGERLGRWQASGAAAWAAAGLAALLAARELGWLSFPLPERRRQAEKLWYQQFGAVTAAALWGLHIGIGLHTRVRFGGFWLLVAVAVLGRDPFAGALLLGCYWLGRALPLWAAPLLFSRVGAGVELLAPVARGERAQRRSHALALAMAALALGRAALA
jgi:cytochrome c biogenesis protein CcdA